MGQTKYQVSLAVDGKHTVSVQSDDPAAVTEGLVWAQQTYKKLVTLRSIGPTRGVDFTAQGPKQQATLPEEPPLCANHHTPMVWVNKNGGFWSCHKKNPDGSWCDYRPAV
jgi:hypothetical protein